MFAKSVIDSDAFLDMPQSTQLLYFHLSMRADDDGFVNNPRSIMRNVKCNEDDFRILCAKQYLIPFETGIVVIRHWKIHNYIQKDRYQATKYKDEFDSLALDDNKAYFQPAEQLCIQDVYNTDTQVRLGKDIDRLDKDSLVKDSTGKNISLSEKKEKEKERKAGAVSEETLAQVESIKEKIWRGE